LNETSDFSSKKIYSTILNLFENSVIIELLIGGAKLIGVRRSFNDEWIVEPPIKKLAEPV